MTESYSTQSLNKTAKIDVTSINDDAISWINGVETSLIDSADRGLYYGDGLFETVAIVNGQPQLWSQHEARLQAGCERLSITGVDMAALTDEVIRHCSRMPKGILKVIITRGCGGRGYAAPNELTPTRIIRLSKASIYPATHREQGIKVRVCQQRLSHNAQLAGIKHLNRLEQVLARQEWQDEWVEGLMCNQHGEVIEGTMSNVFMVKADVLITPAIIDCGIAGVMRGMILDSARALGINTLIQAISIDELMTADEVFIGNSLIGIWPVRQLDAQHFPVGPQTQGLMQAVSPYSC